MSFTSSADAARVLLTRSTGQAIPSGTGWTDVDLTTTTTNTGVAAFTIDLVSNSLTCTRAATYNLAGLVHYAENSGANLNTTEMRLLRNGAAISGSSQTATHYHSSVNAGHNGSAPNWRTPSNIALSAGDVIKLQARHNNGSQVQLTKAWLGAFEVFPEGYDLQRFDANYIWWNFPDDTGAPTCSTSTSWQFPGLTYTATTLPVQQFEATPFRRPNIVTFGLVENHITAGTTEVQLWVSSAEFGVNSSVVDTTPTRKLLKTVSVNDSGRTNTTQSFDSGEIDALMSLASRFGMSFALRYRSADGAGQTQLISPRLLFFYR